MVNQASLSAGERVGSVLSVMGEIGWSFDRGAEAEVSKRTHILIRLFKRSRADAPLALDDQLLQIADVPAPVPVSVS